MNEEHKKLKEICDKIGYISDFPYCDYNIEYYEDLGTREGYQRIINVREIIFTQEFMKKLGKAMMYVPIHKDIRYSGIKWILGLFNHLDDPVEYLHKLLF